MALDFPTAPSVGDTYTSGGVVWTWDGSKWQPGGLAVAYLPMTGGELTGSLGVGVPIPTSPAPYYGAQGFIQDLTIPGSNAIRFNCYVGPGPNNYLSEDGTCGFIYNSGGLQFGVGPSGLAGEVVTAFGTMSLDYNGNLTAGGSITATDNVSGWDFHVGGTLFCPNPNAVNTMAGDLTVNGGNISIPTNGSSVLLYGQSGLYSDANYFMIGDSGLPQQAGQWKYYYVKTTGARTWSDYTNAAVFQITPGGTCYCPGGFFTGSDANGKRDIEPATIGMDALRAITPSYFYRIHPEPPADQPGWGVEERRELGLIAQDVQTALPEAVIAHSTETSTTLSIEPMALIAALINAVKELNQRVETLEANYGS